MRRDADRRSRKGPCARLTPVRMAVGGALVCASLTPAYAAPTEKEQQMDIPLIGGLGPQPGWSDLDRMTTRIKAAPFGQSWLPGLEAGFQPGEVRVFRTERHLVVLGTMTDAAPANSSRGLNAMHFRKGDVFEVFLKPPGGEAYWEIHVTPEGETYQVRIPSAVEFQSRRKEAGTIEELVKPYLLEPPAARCLARRVEDRPGWDAAVFFPLPAESSGEWRVSGCRYDHPAGGGEPVLSSISPLTRRDFHHQPDWLTFVTAPP
jgi:hypothetical protein